MSALRLVLLSVLSFALMAQAPAAAPSATPAPAAVTALADFLNFAVGDAAAGFAQSKQRAADGDFQYSRYLTDCYYGAPDTTLGARVACFVSTDLPLNGSSLHDAVANALPAGFEPEAPVLDGEYSWSQQGKLEISLDTSSEGTSLMVEDIRPL